LVASGSDDVSDKEAGFKVCEQMDFSNGFKKCKVMLKNPCAGFVAVKSEDIDLI